MTTSVNIVESLRGQRQTATDKYDGSNVNEKQLDLCDSDLLLANIYHVTGHPSSENLTK